MLTGEITQRLHDLIRKDEFKAGKDECKAWEMNARPVKMNARSGKLNPRNSNSPAQVMGMRRLLGWCLPGNLRKIVLS